MPMSTDRVIFAFDTCGTQDSLALNVHNITYQKSLPPAPSGEQASRLVPEIITFFQEHGLSLENMTTLLTVSGPGSFTGIRLGLATAQGLVFGKPTQALCTTKLTLMAHQFLLNNPVNPEFYVLIPKNREEYYYAHFIGNVQPQAIGICEKENLLLQGKQIITETFLNRNNAADLIELYLKNRGEGFSHELSPYYIHNPEFKKQARFSHD